MGDIYSVPQISYVKDPTYALCCYRSASLYEVGLCLRGCADGIVCLLLVFAASPLSLSLGFILSCIRESDDEAALSGVTELLMQCQTYAKSFTKPGFP